MFRKLQFEDKAAIDSYLMGRPGYPRLHASLFCGLTERGCYIDDLCRVQARLLCWYSTRAAYILGAPLDGDQVFLDGLMAEGCILETADFSGNLRGIQVGSEFIYSVDDWVGMPGSAFSRHRWACSRFKKGGTIVYGLFSGLVEWVQGWCRAQGVRFNRSFSFWPQASGDERFDFISAFYEGTQAGFAFVEYLPQGPAVIHFTPDHDSPVDVCPILFHSIALRARERGYEYFTMGPALFSSVMKSSLVSMKRRMKPCYEAPYIRIGSASRQGYEYISREVL